VFICSTQEKNDTEETSYIEGIIYICVAVVGLAFVCYLGPKKSKITVVVADKNGKYDPKYKRRVRKVHLEKGYQKKPPIEGLNQQ
jgi:hypothetical protein